MTLAPALGAQPTPMPTSAASTATPWPDAMLVAALLAVDGHGLGGVIVHDRAGEGAARWLRCLRALLQPSAAIRRMPSHISDDRLVGGLDLSGTLAAGRRVLQRGLLSEADGGFVLAPAADRLATVAIAHVTAALDQGAVALERDGLSARVPARFGVIAHDEAGEDGEPLSAALADRLAFTLEFEARFAEPGTDPSDVTLADVAMARERLATVEVADDIVQAICEAAVACGIASIRAPVLAIRTARVLAALAGREHVTDKDAETASRLVLGPRLMVPLEQPPEQPSAQPPPEPPPPTPPDDSTDAPAPSDAPDGDAEDQPEMPSLEDLVLAAAMARLPARLIDQLQSTVRLGRGRGAGRRSRLKQASPRRGRPVGVKRETRRGAQRIDLVATLRAAAPWQRLRNATADPADGAPRIAVRREDFHVKRLKQTPVSVAIFVVDASGSSALNRLAEAKGAVELLLADCYVRRDEVAVIAFRGKVADVLLPPTRSLVRAKRALAGLPGGGGTPLAAGLTAAMEVAAVSLRKGHAPIVVVLTDGRANIDRNGAPGRRQAEADALDAARQLRTLGVSTLVVDTSPRPDPLAARLAETLAARYLALPYADAASLSGVVKRTAIAAAVDMRTAPVARARS